MQFFKRILLCYAQTSQLQCRLAGNYKRTLPGEQLLEFKQHLYTKGDSLTAAEWQQTRQLLIDNHKNIGAHNVDAVIVGVCNEPQHLQIAKNYINYLRVQNVSPSAASLGRLLRVYNLAYHAKGLSATEKQEVLDICKHLRQKHQLLDASSCEYLICGLVCIDQWQEAKELLEMMKISSTPSNTVYNELAIKAFSTQDMAYGWQLLTEMLQMGKLPKCELYIAYLQTIAKLTASQFCLEFEKLLALMEQHELFLTEKVIQYMQDLSKQQPKLINCARTKLERLGKCSNCGEFMQNVCISTAEFTQLKDVFLQKVLIRKDIFQKSTPAEVERFQQFVEQTAPYDCVIDGLNVAYSAGSQKSPQIMTNLLCAVVKYFQLRQKRILILGRKHMLNWPKQPMQFVRKNALMFLTNDLTHDDPFLLYATLKSGPLTDFFSRDLMRSHAHLLGPQLKSIFRRWQMEHQYSLISKIGKDGVLVKEPIGHLIGAHKAQQHWHVPYRQEYNAKPAETFEVPDHWLCLKIHKQ